MQLTDADLRAVLDRSFGEHQHGHSHFWQRVALSRRQFIGSTAAMAGAAVGAGLLPPIRAFADAGPTAAPVPIPPHVGGTFAVWLPSPTGEPSTITDFNGVVGIVDVTGTGTGSDGGDHFAADIRFMDGVFAGADGEIHQGTFGFV
jgi:Rieske Fe-S protein